MEMVRSRAGTPTAQDFQSPFGTPIVIDTVANEGYFFNGGQMYSLKNKLANVTDYYLSTDLGTFDNAFARAFAARNTVFLPEATLSLNSALVLGFGKSIFGQGTNSVISNSGTTEHVVVLGDERCSLSGFKVSGGNAGLYMRGTTGACVYNSVNNILFQDNQNAIVLDGYTDTSKPCYWNTFSSNVVRDPHGVGVRLIKSGAGDSPNSNSFFGTRIFSSRTSCPTGIDLESGNNQNSFFATNIELTSSASQCVRVRSGVDGAAFYGLYTETNGAVDNVQLDAGSGASLPTILSGLVARSGGAQITGSGGYVAHTAGFPWTDFMAAAVIQKVSTGRVLFGYDGEAVTPSTATLYEHRYANAAPITGSYSQGAVVWNSAAASAGFAGWICVTPGTPGTWKTFGLIS